VADFDVTSPDGRKFRITAPEGATQEQVLAFAQKSLAGAGAGPMGMAAAGVGAAGETLDKAADSLGGMTTDALAKVFPPEVAAAGGAAVKLGPSLVGGGLARLAAAPLMQGGARKLMQQALAPSVKALKSGKGDDAVKTLLDEGVNVTRGGVAKLDAKVDEVNEQISGLLQKHSGTTVDKEAVAARIGDTVKRIQAEHSTPQEALKNVDKVYNDFIDNGLIPDKIPVLQAQKLKQGIYRMLKDKYGQLQSESVEAQKALGRGYKETVAEAIPEISKLNAREGQLINALSLAEHRALMSGNRSIGGWSFLAGNKEALAALLADRSPLFKSIVARLMHSRSKDLPTAAGVGAGALYSASEE
jgi:hypothetical protein